MTGSRAVSRAGAFAAVGLLALVVPGLQGRVSGGVATVAAVGPFAAVAVAALTTEEGRVFEALARPGDYERGRLYGLAGFALAAAGLALLATQFGLPAAAYVGSVFALTGGALAQAVVRARAGDPFVGVVGFVAGGLFSSGAGIALAGALVGRGSPAPLVVFLAATGAVTAALLRTLLFERDDPLVMISVALLLWAFVELGVEAPATRVAVGFAVTVVLGYVAYALGTASLAGMLTGVLLALLAVVLGGYGWFALLVTFFGLGGLAAKFRYEEKRERGIAEANQGARGSGNVLANSAAALAAVLLFAASDAMGVDPAVFRFAFSGAVAAAMSDTLSSEIGGLYDRPRLVTTLEVVAPGTDGAVTWQGELAGVVGAGLIAGIGALAFAWGPLATGVVVLAGVVGMTVDSLLGATLEGRVLDNQGVNLVATAAAAVVGAVAAAGVGLP